MKNKVKSVNRQGDKNKRKVSEIQKVVVENVEWFETIRRVSLGETPTAVRLRDDGPGSGWRSVEA